jgi:Heavy metal associated domain 2
MSSHFHHVPGRLRVRLPRLKGDAAAGLAVSAAMRELPGVGLVETNAVTGSVIIHYDPRKIAPPSLLDALRSYGYAPEPAPSAKNAKPSERLATSAAKAAAWFLAEKAIERAVPLVLSAIF